MFLASGDGRDFRDHAIERDKVRKRVMAAASGMVTNGEDDTFGLVGGKEITKEEYKSGRGTSACKTIR